MLEIVRVQFALNQRSVRGHIVGELHHFERVARLGQHVLCRLQDLRMGRGRRADRNGLCRVIRCAAVIRVLVLAVPAAGCKRCQAQRARKQSCDFLFHNQFSPFLIGGTARGRSAAPISLI